MNKKSKKMYFVCCCYIEHMTTFPLGADSTPLQVRIGKKMVMFNYCSGLWEHVNRNLHPTSESVSAARKKTKAP